MGGEWCLILRTSLAFCKATGAVDPSIEPRVEGALKGYWASFRTVSWQWAVSYLRILNPALPLVKPKTSSKVLGWDMETRGWDAIWGCWTGLKGFSGQ